MPESKRRILGRTFAVALTAVIAVGALSGCGWSTMLRGDEGAIDDLTNAPFYVPPDPVPAGAPGDIVRSEKILEAPSDSEAWRVLFHSTDVHGADIVVSGVVVVPATPMPEGGRPVLSWGHPTTGATGRCAPSVGIDPFDTIEGLRTFLDAGYIVAASDYPGLGAPSPNSYLIGESEGNSVLDAARAARTLAHDSANHDLVLWGHSQGGHAVLFAAQDAAEYAPEFTLLAAAVAAPATELGELLGDDINDVSGVTIGSYAFNAYAEVYGPSTPGASLDTILTPAGAAATPTMAGLCLFGENSELHSIAKPLVGAYLKSDPTETQPWATLLDENTPGATPLTVPLFVAQGETDTLVRPSATAEFVAHECAIGTNVTSLRIPSTGHGLVALRAVEPLMKWLASPRDVTPSGATRC
jgi:pimeloyl-ACP methyl ester carboxylesterase